MKRYFFTNILTEGKKQNCMQIMAAQSAKRKKFWVTAVCKLVKQ